MSQHARLQPSTAHRWMTCPGSVAFAAAFPDRPTRPAAEGTLCHLMLSRLLAGGGAEFGVGCTHVVEGFPVEITEEMQDWTAEIAIWVEDYVAAHPGAWVLSEERVCPGLAFGCPDDFWGTADVLISEPDRLTVLDAKFGYRPVQVVENPQLLSYALGAMAEFAWIHPNVTLAIYQPRAGGLKTWDLSAAELRDRVPALLPKVLAALTPGAPLVATEEACEFCPAAGGCPEAQKKALALAREEFQLSPISQESLLTLLDNADRVRDALHAAEQYAEALLAAGHELPGWKRVYAEKRRAWVHEEEAVSALRKLGYDPYREPKVVTPAMAEKMVGRATAKLLAPLIERPRGEPRLARASDDRDPVAPEFPAE